MSSDYMWSHMGAKSAASDGSGALEYQSDNIAEVSHMTRAKVLRFFGVILTLGLTVSVTNPALAYNGGAAASYADSWWNGRNVGAFPSFSDDCTDFVSQALYSGGETMSGYPYNISDSAWWSDAASSGGYTHSWSIINDLIQFYADYSHRGTFGPVSYAPTSGGGTLGLNQGDVLAYDWGQGAGISHSSIIVVQNGKDPTYGYTGTLIDQHTYDRYHEIWTLYPTNSLWASTSVSYVHITN